MRVVALQEKDRTRLKALEAEREECYKRMVAARNEYDALLKALVLSVVGPADASNTSYRLDDTENFLVVGAGGEWRRP